MTDHPTYEDLDNPVPRLRRATEDVGTHLITVSHTLRSHSGPSDTARQMKALAPKLVELSEALELWDRWLDGKLHR